MDCMVRPDILMHAMITATNVLMESGVHICVPRCDSRSKLVGTMPRMTPKNLKVSDAIGKSMKDEVVLKMSVSVPESRSVNMYYL